MGSVGAIFTKLYTDTKTFVRLLIGFEAKITPIFVKVPMGDDCHRCGGIDPQIYCCHIIGSLYFGSVDLAQFLVVVPL